MSKKIKKVDEVTDLSVYTKFIKDEGMFQIEASVYSMVEQKEQFYGHDISEIELKFLINGKKVQYTGFKTLYEQLYGKDTFGDFYYEKSEEFEKEYLKTSPYKTK
tara:strand:- start:301 stop:615 length:315 start_codon:yes stop_codon:yes gene_type:complete